MAGGDVIGEYLAEVRRSLGDAAGRERLIEELEAHLDDAAARHRAAALPPAAAAAQAVQECGSASAVADAVAANDERKAYLMAMTRWTGLAGLAAVPSALVGMMLWNYVSFMATIALAAVAIIGLLVAHWRLAPRHIAVGLAALVVGQVVAATNPIGSAHPLYTAGIPAGLTLLAVALVVVAFLRGDIVPAVPAWLILGGMVAMLGVNAVRYLVGAEPSYVAGAGGVAALVGWIWTNAALIARGFGRRSISPA